MMQFKLYDIDSAPDASKPTLKAVEADFKMIPNLERVMAESPGLVAAYAQAWELFGASSFSPIEQQVVYLTANYLNECRYCVPWHSLLANKAGMSDADVEALRVGGRLSDPKLEALRQFTKAMISERGNVPAAEREAFEAAGYGPRAALDVVLGVAVKTMSNYTNALVDTPLDAPPQPLQWTKPRSTWPVQP